jgi:hypothetical protein
MSSHFEWLVIAALVSGRVIDAAAAAKGLMHELRTWTLPQLQTTGVDIDGMSGTSPHYWLEYRLSNDRKNAITRAVNSHRAAAHIRIAVE